MSAVNSIKDLIDNLQVVGVDSYLGRGSVGSKVSVYGGQVVAQSLIAACKSVQEADSDFLIHSLHCYFVGPTLYNRDILYGVQRIREGKTFSSYIVDASQTGSGGGTTCKCMVSFDKPETANNAFDFASRTMPVVPHPDRPDDPVESDRMLLIDFEKVRPRSVVTPGLRVILCSSPQEIADVAAKKPTPAKFVFWVKATSGSSELDHQNYHRCVIAFVSDLIAGLPITKVHPTVKRGKMASLDHSVWFHANCNSQDWHLLVLECGHCRGGRSLNTQWIYSENGTLVATCQQDFLIRPKL